MFNTKAVSGIPEKTRKQPLHAQCPGHIVTVLIRQHDVTDTVDGSVIGASGQNISQLIAEHGIHSSLQYGGIDTVRGIAIGAITYEFSGDGVDAFLAELARNSDIIDFGTADDQVPYEQALATAGQE